MRVHASLKQTTFKNVKTETAHPFFCNPWQIYFSPAGHSPWHRRWHPVRSWGHGRSCSPSGGYFCPGNSRGWSSTPWMKALKIITKVHIAPRGGIYTIYRNYYIWTYENAKKLSFWLVSTKNPKELWKGSFPLHLFTTYLLILRFFFITLQLCRSGPASFPNPWRKCVSQSNTWWFLQILRTFQLTWY